MQGIDTTHHDTEERQPIQDMKTPSQTRFVPITRGHDPGCPGSARVGYDRSQAAISDLARGVCFAGSVCLHSRHLGCRGPSSGASAAFPPRVRDVFV